MVKKYPKGTDQSLSENFTTAQFDCHCKEQNCTSTLVDDDLINALEEICAVFPRITVNSGFRCTAHNEAIGGKVGSIHLLGKAADICTIFAKPPEIYFAADKIEIFKNGGAGVYSNFVHLDVRGYRARWGLERLN